MYILLNYFAWIQVEAKKLEVAFVPTIEEKLQAKKFVRLWFEWGRVYS
jgi:hypothetical protein